MPKEIEGQGGMVGTEGAGIVGDRGDAGEPAGSGDALGDSFSEEGGEVAQTAEEIKWADYGLERYDTMTREQIANEHKYRGKIYGDQSNREGEYKRQIAEQAKQLEEFHSLAGREPEKPAEDFSMSAGQKTDFYENFERNPQEAIWSLVQGQVEKMLKDPEMLTETFSEQLQDMFGQYHDYSQKERVMSDPKYPEHAPYIELLSQPEHLGNTRTHRELLDFALLHKENATLADETYDWMKKYRDMTFDECRTNAAMRLRDKGATEDDKDNFRKKVANLTGVEKGGGVQKKSQADKIDSMDDAFDMED